MRHLPSWILLPLFLFTSCTYAQRPCDSNDPNTTVAACVGGNASFCWDNKVRPFHLVEWYFGKIQIAETLTDSLSQDSLSINENYKYRFVLLETGSIGFNITNVRMAEKGTYKCILNLRETSIPMEFEKTLDVTDAGEQKCKYKPPPESGEEEQPPASDSPGTANPVAVAVPVVIAAVIVVIAVIAVVRFVIIRKKRKSIGENQDVRTEAETRSESLELVEDEIKSPAENGEESQYLVENKEA